MKILIAEDELVSRRVLEAVLTKWGYEVLTTSNGTEAWEQLQRPESPKLAILDWMMPGVDGVEICRRLRRQETSEPTYVILLTSRHGTANIVEGLRAGANDYIAKPFENDELQARVDVGRRVVELQAALSARVRELQDALDHVKTLQGILPICMYCHKIRTDEESWQRIETYLTEQTDVHLSHGLCPDCAKQHYADM